MADVLFPRSGRRHALHWFARGKAFRRRSQDPAIRLDVSNRRFPAKRAPLTKPDGTPNYEAAFTEDFYDHLIIGVSRMLTGGAILASPVAADSVIYVGSTDGNLYALQ
jgi:PQQ-like domain